MSEIFLALFVPVRTRVKHQARLPSPDLYEIEFSRRACTEKSLNCLYELFTLETVYMRAYI